jgi:CheY-like chemotaxis protein
MYGRKTTGWKQVNMECSAHRVLVVDDDPDTLEVLSMIFSLLGHDVAGVASGREAIEVAPSFAPTLIALDIGLGDVDGYTVARALRASAQLGGAFLVALTGYATLRDVSRSAKAGFDRHVAKPVDIADIRALCRDANVRRCDRR